MTVEGFRRLALSLPETTESEHMGHPDFRVCDKIFATIWPKESWGMVKLTPDQQQSFIDADPIVFFPVKGGWGLRGATHVRISKAKKAVVHHALATAWRNTAPKRLLEKLDKEI